MALIMFKIKRSIIVILTLFTGIALLTVSALADSGTEGGTDGTDCPTGTYSVAKVQFNETGDNGDKNITIDEWEYGDQYVNVTVTGFNQGYWESSPYQITAVAYKIDNYDVEGEYLVDYSPDWRTNDTFAYSDSESKPPKAISHIAFCATSTTPPVPELPTIALTSIGLLGVLLMYRRLN
ncbi:MAG: hypothetical protein ACLFVX_10005 [Archaeoglobaceae archaeon]